MDGPQDSLMQAESSRRSSNQDFSLPGYKLGNILGRGSFCKVRLAEHVLTGYKVAAKILKKRKIREEVGMEEKVKREIKIMRLLMHPHIIRLYEVIETDKYIFIMMEYAKCRELFDHIVENGHLNEDEARRFFQQIISGVEHCHRNMVVHRDLKPENLLLDSDHNVKIADFGLSNFKREGYFLHTSCGSINYAAPEVVSQHSYVGPEVDVWSCGVVLYTLLCGSLPFDDDNISNLFRKIMGGSYTLPSYLSAGARDLISRMLLVDPLQRVTIPDIKQHPWFLPGLSHYLTILPLDAAEQAKKVHGDILQEVVRLGFDRSQLVDSLQKREKNKMTATYYLILDNQHNLPNRYLGGDVIEASDAGHA